MREIRKYSLKRGRWPVRHSTAGWGLLHRALATKAGKREAESALVGERRQRRVSRLQRRV